jgi:hypothetical protein
VTAYDYSFAVAPHERASGPTHEVFRALGPPRLELTVDEAEWPNVVDCLARDGLVVHEAERRPHVEYEPVPL